LLHICSTVSSYSAAAVDAVGAVDEAERVGCQFLIVARNLVDFIGQTTKMLADRSARSRTRNLETRSKVP